MQSYVHLSIVFWLYTVLQYRSSRSSNFLVFHTSGGISLSPAAFLFLIFFVLYQILFDGWQIKNKCNVLPSSKNRRGDTIINNIIIIFKISPFSK